MKFKTTVIACGIYLVGQSAVALDASRYKALVADTISGISGPSVDVAQMVNLQEQLIATGVQAALAQAEASPQSAKLLNFVASQAEAMQRMSLDEIEAEWHDGEALAKIGIDFDALDHFGTEISYMDAIIHPATAIIALREYQDTGQKSYLVQVKDELSEVVEHISHLN